MNQRGTWQRMSTYLRAAHDGIELAVFRFDDSF